MKRRGKRSFRSRRGGDGGALLFVYGTLRAASGHPMHRMLRAEAEFVVEGTFRGALYDLGAFPGAIASHRNCDRVRGEIYRLRAPARMLRVLDAYEDKAFRRVKVAVRKADGEASRCWIYLYGRPLNRFPRIASGDFIKRHG
ncbi:MAG TPA: gamma-glutamylcyclotransferase family protein [Verrucomicrobiae bacterium]|jgi:gamma-glutamylcyclotransferase (GGCT)/AIG2-like uncharacterized protein YtfP|nr:gamma-glutamylcyclotransferase family protein [Verrucomicrobiae bacterium]